MKKASIGVRFGALLLDSLIIDFIYVFAFFLLPYTIYTYFLYPIILFLYYGICEGSTMSASLGKKICGLVVVDENGNRLTSAKGFTRAIGRILSSLIFGIGYLIALFDEDGKALHDRIAGTFVTYEGQYPAMAATSNSSGYTPKVICVTGQYAGKAFDIKPQGITFGRDSNICELTFSESTKGISRVHCKIQYNPETQMFVIYDMGSTYGTFLENGSRVMQGQPIALRTGEGFYLASNLNSFRVGF